MPSDEVEAFKDRGMVAGDVADKDVVEAEHAVAGEAPHNRRRRSDEQSFEADAAVPLGKDRFDVFKGLAVGGGHENVAAQYRTRRAARCVASRPVGGELLGELV